MATHLAMVDSKVTLAVLVSWVMSQGERVTSWVTCPRHQKQQMARNWDRPVSYRSFVPMARSNVVCHSSPKASWGASYWE